MRRAAAALVFGCASVLLAYPEESFAEDLEAVGAALCRLPRSAARGHLDGTRAALAALSPMEAAERYVETFDLRRRRTLHVTYYRHGDTRERGMALAALVDAYRSAGLKVVQGELPDHLPALLELAALSPLGATLLGEHRLAVDALAAELDREESAYAGAAVAVTDALGGLSRGDQAALARYRAQGPPSERVGLEPFAPPEVVAGGLTAPDVSSVRLALPVRRR